MDYTKEELEKLHMCLYDILKEIKRVCDMLDIHFVMLGGSAIGVYYWSGIIPFDDDIDIGMTRGDYEKFLSEAPPLLDKKYFLQWFGSEKHYPLFFAKVRRNDSLFVEEIFSGLDIHQGIYVDILPIDHIPDRKIWRYIQRKSAVLINECFVSKELWRYRWLGKCQIKTPVKSNFWACLFFRAITVLLSKGSIYRLLRFIQSRYNHRVTQYCNTIPTYCDFIRTEDLENLKETTFGGIDVWVPNHLEDYLRRHYPTLKKNLSEEERLRYSHRPQELKLPE